MRPNRRLLAGIGILIPAFLGANPFANAPGAPRIEPVAVQPWGWVPDLTALRDHLAAVLGQWAAQPTPQALGVLLALAFAYGVVHALGPGHRKVIVFTLYLARRAPWWEPLAMGTLLAALHGGTAVVLLLVFHQAKGALSVATHLPALVLEGLSYSLLVVLALVLWVQAWKEARNPPTTGDQSRGLGALLLSGLYPCPGALLILIFSLSQDILTMGILAVGAMSLGMALPIVAFAYLGWAGRTGLLSLFRGQEARWRQGGHWLELGAYTLLFALSLWIAWPFLASVTEWLFV